MPVLVSAELGVGLIYLPPSETLPKAKAAAMKALEVDSTLAEAHSALAYASYFWDWDWSSAEREFKRAVELNPNSALAHQRYSECLQTRLRFDESLAEGERAQELDPLSPQVLAELAYVYLSSRRYDEAITGFQKALDLEPDAAWIRAELAWAFAMKGMYAQALAEYGKIREQDKTVANELRFVFDQLPVCPPLGASRRTPASWGATS